MLEIGQVAPDFTLPDKDGNMISLSELRGKKVVLYFYARDNTSGCTRQAQAFAALNGEFEARSAVVVGISKDTAKSHANFAQKYELPFILLADTERTAIEAYDVWKEKKLYGKVSMGVVRTTYLIDENGVTVAAFDKVKPDTNAKQMLDVIDSIK